MNIKAYLQQPTTISGIEKIAMGLVAAAGLYANGQKGLAIVSACAGLAGGIVGIGMPDNTTLAADATSAVTKFVTDIEGRDQQQALADAFAGAVKVLSDIQAKLPPTAPAANGNAAPPPAA